mmetsp:Transcript_25241/g.74098  ORF Transcript_25241/g.74098 Transcript_25241/m.74098 type:complete len:414 (+) Transcript_25241:22-1263(+)
MYGGNVADFCTLCWHSHSHSPERAAGSPTCCRRARAPGAPRQHRAWRPPSELGRSCRGGGLCASALFRSLRAAVCHAGRSRAYLIPGLRLPPPRCRRGERPVARPVPVELAAHQRLVLGAALEQVLVAALPGHAPLREQHDGVGVHHGAQAVGDDDGGAVLHEALQGRLHQRLALRVQGGGGLVQEEERGVVKQRARDGHPLFLPAGEAHPALADKGVVAVGEARDEVVRVGLARRRLHGAAQGCRVRVRRGRRLHGTHACAAHPGLVPAAGPRRPRVRRVARRPRARAVGDVVRHGAGKEHGLLTDQRHLAPQPPGIHAPQIHAVQKHRAASRVVETHEEGDDGALARAGGPHQRHRGAVRDAQREAVEHRRLLAAGVGEGDCFEGHARDRGGRGGGAGGARAAGHDAARER